MIEETTSAPSGMRVREIETEKQVVDGKDVVVPKLDAQGNEIELYSIAVPQHLEAAEGSAEARAALIDGFVADVQTKGAEVALVRADAVVAGKDPAAAETAFVQSQETVSAVVVPVATA